MEFGTTAAEAAMIQNRVPELVTRKMRGQVNLSEVQRDTGLTYSTVSRWMKHQIDRVDFDTLEIWCRYLNCQVSDLLIYVPDAPGQ
jgi:DNA-binding Xre family transcriptional regulator